MSKTALQVIKRGMRELGILQTQEEPSSDEAQDALEVLNTMLYAWDLDGIRLNHVDVVLTDTMPYPDNHITPIAYNFAVEYAAEFGVDLRSDTVQKATNGYRNLQNYYYSPDEMSVDPALSSYYSPNRYFTL
jgi:hypothetical protein